VFDALKLPVEAYASNPSVKFQAKNDTDKALRTVLGYRLYRDLKRGWRVTSPNLEQCGLLEIRYPALDELCAAEDEWRNTNPHLQSASPEDRKQLAKVLLDYMRRELAIKGDYRGNVYLSGRSAFGQFLGPYFGGNQRLTLDDKQRIISDLLRMLEIGGIVEALVPKRTPD